MAGFAFLLKDGGNVLSKRGARDTVGSRNRRHERHRGKRDGQKSNRLPCRTHLENSFALEVVPSAYTERSSRRRDYCNYCRNVTTDRYLFRVSAQPARPSRVPPQRSPEGQRKASQLRTPDA